MGIYYLESRLYPNRFYISQVGEANLYEPYKWEDVFKIIYDSGYEKGTEAGEKKKIEEIKRVLQIGDSE